MHIFEKLAEKEHNVKNTDANYSCRQTAVGIVLYLPLVSDAYPASELAFRHPVLRVHA